MSRPRGRPFEPGNKMGRGRRKGSRNKRAAQAQQILDQYIDPLMRKCVAKAMEGDTRALGLCIERILPAMREPGVRIRMPKLKQIKDIDLALQRIVDGVANGNVTPAEGERLHAMLQNHRDNVQDREFEARLLEVEKQAPPKP
jgi:hypothetical protein